ncbi:MAG: alpha/beta fold hydrolase [bacterium]
MLKPVHSLFRASFFASFFLLFAFTQTQAALPSRDGTVLSRKTIESNNKWSVFSVVYLSDGLKVRGKLIVPKSKTAKKNKSLPAVVFNHGGVDGIPAPLLKRGKQLAGDGYVVFAPSYRGEDGSEGAIEVAAGEVNDALNAVKVLRTMPEVDPKRIAMLGASHGGIITLLSIERDPSLAAAVCAYGVTNTFTWYKYLVDSGFDVHDDLSQRVYGNGPEDKPEAFRSRAPALDAHLISAPLLLLYGEKDATVPPSQGKELAAALDRHGIPYELRIIPDAGHGFLFFMDPVKRSALEIRRSNEAWSAVAGFLNKHLKK